MGERLLLVQAPSMGLGSEFHDYIERYQNPMLIEIASFLLEHEDGLEVELRDYRALGEASIKLEELMGMVEKELSGGDYTVFGISSYTSMAFIPSVFMAVTARVIDSDLRIVVGGEHARALPSDFYNVIDMELRVEEEEDGVVVPQKFFEFKEDLERMGEDRGNVFDYVVSGEGEVPLLNILRKNGRPNRMLTVEGVQLGEEDLNSVDYRWELMEPYKFKNGSTWVCLSLSRGCYNSCSFCSTKFPERWRALSPKKAVRELKKINELYAPNTMVFYDSNFGYKRRWKEKFLELLKQEFEAKREKVDFRCETRIDQTSPKDLEAYRDANFAVLQFGVDGVSKRMARIMNKTKNPSKYLEQARIVADKLAEMGRDINAEYFAIFGFPGETPESLNEGVEFLQGLPDMIRRAVNQYVHWPGSPAFEKMEEYERVYGTKFHMPPEYWKIITPKLGDIMRHLSPSRSLSYEKVKETVEKLRSLERIWEYMQLRRKGLRTHSRKELFKTINNPED
ncbi:MAG: radical SAM protein [Candidatus Wukongarchaeota archaeon]|nr:B12-binding domain-containing radical SAM protein [Candidatus Wukongarchaeota archaeon]